MAPSRSLSELAFNYSTDHWSPHQKTRKPACEYRFYRGVFHDNKYLEEILKEQKDIFKEINI